MAKVDKSTRLHKEITLLGVYAIATGATLSGGLFLLPGLAAEQAGPAVVLCYLLAVVPLVPAMYEPVARMRWTFSPIPPAILEIMAHVFRVS